MKREICFWLVVLAFSCSLPFSVGFILDSMDRERREQKQKQIAREVFCQSAVELGFVPNCQLTKGD